MSLNMDSRILFLFLPGIVCYENELSLAPRCLIDLHGRLSLVATENDRKCEQKKTKLYPAFLALISLVLLLSLIPIVNVNLCMNPHIFCRWLAVVIVLIREKK